jgi:hypothetical protein
MKPYLNYRTISLVIGYHLMMAGSLVAQDLDPRAYLWLPINTNTIIAGYSYSHGGILTDPTLPIEDLEATVQGASLGYVHSFGLFGLTSSALVAVPYSWAEASGKVVGQSQSITRSGLADSRLRLTVLVHGGPAVGVQEFIKAQKKTLVGVSMNIGAPTGEFFSDKLINIGTHRWSFKPEVALSQPIGKRWLLDAYAGVWFFTTNYSFYPGTSKRSQDPMGAFQVHISYNITPRLWVAINSTYYVGGESAIDDVNKDDRQSNSRLGLTAVMPVGKSNSIKLAASTGAVVRVGQDFTTFSFGWQHSWLGKPKEKAAQPE